MILWITEEIIMDANVLFIPFFENFHRNFTFRNCMNCDGVSSEELFLVCTSDDINTTKLKDT